MAAQQDTQKELQELKDHNLRLKKALENAIAGILVTDAEGNITFASQKWLEIHGYEKPEDVLEKHVRMFFQDKIFENKVIPLLESIKRNKVETIELKGKRKDGSIISTFLKLECIKNPDNSKITGFSWGSIDITEQKARETELDLFFKLSIDMLAIANTEGYFEKVSPAFEEALGWNEKEMYAKPFMGLVHPDDRENTIEEMKKLSRGDVILEFRNRYKMKSGKYKWLEWSARPTDEGKLYAIARDVTKSYEADRMKTEFISLASHQLRTPLSAIKWFLEILVDEDEGSLNKIQKEYVKNINASNERMIAIVNSLLNIARIESGRLIVNPEPTDLKKLVQGILRELEVKIKQKEVLPKLIVDKNVPKMHIDPKLIKNVYANLIDNSIKYSPEGAEINVHIFKRDNEVISQISNIGYGIPEKERQQVFTKFFRGSNILKFETDGTGLGLYLVKSIVEASEGRIWFESEENGETSFCFSLPLEGSTAKDGEVTLDS